MNDKRILVVDDETDLLEMVKSIFTRAGFTQILTASSGEAALKMCEEQEPDMMIINSVFFYSWFQFAHVPYLLWKQARLVLTQSHR